jgi:hypothetical protein
VRAVRADLLWRQQRVQREQERVQRVVEHIAQQVHQAGQHADSPMALCTHTM